MPPVSSPRKAAAPFTRLCRWALVAYVVLDWVRPHEMYGFVPGILFKLMAATMMGTWLLAVLVEGRRPRWHLPQFRMMYLLLGLMAVSMVFARVSTYSLYALRWMGVYVVLVLLIGSTVLEDLKHFRWFLGWLGLVVGWIAFEGARFYIAPQGRVMGVLAGGFLGDESDYALVVNTFLPLLVCLALAAQARVLRLLYWAAAGCALFSSVFTYSRGGFLALSAMAMFLFLTRSRGRLPVLLAAGAVVLALSLLLPGSYWERFRGLVPERDPYGEVAFPDGSIQGRYWAWGAAIGMALDDPLTGVGPGNFMTSFHEYRPGGDRWDKAAHSMYFQGLGEMGVPGLCWVVAMLALNFRMLRRIRAAAVEREDRATQHLALALTTGLVGWSVGGAFMSVLYYPQLYWISMIVGTLGHFTLEPVPRRVSMRAPRPVPRLVRS